MFSFFVFPHSIQVSIFIVIIIIIIIIVIVVLVVVFRILFLSSCFSKFHPSQPGDHVILPRVDVNLLSES